MTPDRIREMWCNWAVFLAGQPRRLSDPVYRWGVEGRDKGPWYSSCADLPHCLLWIMGCREPWVNREANGDWRPQLNINLLSPPGAPEHGVNPIARRGVKLEQLKPGDIIMTWQEGPNGSHACIFDFVKAGSVHTLDFGQGAMSPEAWRAAPNQVEARPRTRAPWAIPLRSVISLADVPWTAEPLPDAGEVFDAIERGENVQP